MKRPDLVSLLASGASFQEIGAALGVSKATAWRMAQDPEIPALVAAEREARRADTEAVRAEYVRQAHDFAWKVATGTVTIATDDQREWLRYFTERSPGRAIVPAVPPPASEDPEPHPAPAGASGPPLIPPGATVIFQSIGQAPPTPAVDVRRESEDDGILDLTAEAEPRLQ